MNLKTLSISIILASLPTSAVFAAALDRSGQSIQAFLQPGNYFEAGISVLDADVSGKMKDQWKGSGSPGIFTSKVEGTGISDVAESFNFYNAALKIQATDKLSFGLIYDQPFGANARYSTQDATYSGGTAALNNNGAFHRKGEGTTAEVDTKNLSFILGFQPTENWNIYAGPVYQTVKGSVKLRGTAFGPYGGVFCPATCVQLKDAVTNQDYMGYDANIKENSSIGWLAGIAYQIPEIALKASLTYRSEIDHAFNAEERLGYGTGLWVNPAFGGPDGLNQANVTALQNKNEKSKISTPQSVNLDFQTGIMENTIAFAQLRWVDWSNFAIRPHKFGEIAAVLTDNKDAGPIGFDLVSYSKDQISATVGVGRRFTDKWAGSLMTGWDSGAGNPVSVLGPTEGYWSAGLGVQFSPTKDSFIQAGAKYFWLGDAKSQVSSKVLTNEYDAKFKDNHAIGYSLKIGHRF